MTNLKIEWDNPANASGIEENHIYRVAGDHTGVTDMDAFRASGTKVGTVSAGDTFFVDLNVPAGEYTYGVFSSNSVGYGPGDLADSSYTTLIAPTTGPESLDANYIIQTSPQFLSWQYSSTTNNTPQWFANSGSYLIPATAMGGYHISSAGITSPRPYAGVKNYTYTDAGGTSLNVPSIELTNTDLSNLPGWTSGQTTLFAKLPIPFFDAGLNITHFPISYDAFYPLYTTRAEAEARIAIHMPAGSPLNVQEIDIEYPISDANRSPYTDANGDPSVETMKLYLPELTLADANTPYSDFSKRWDVSDPSGNGLPHDDASFPVVDSGVEWNGQMYNYDGTLRT